MLAWVLRVLNVVSAVSWACSLPILPLSSVLLLRCQPLWWTSKWCGLRMLFPGLLDRRCLPSGLAYSADCSIGLEPESNSPYRTFFRMQPSSMPQLWPSQCSCLWVSIANMLDIFAWAKTSLLVMRSCQVIARSHLRQHKWRLWACLLDGSRGTMLLFYRVEYSAHMLYTLSSLCWSSAWCCPKLYLHDES